eukprot:SAG31_NODE_280_length_18592_cov_33.584113_11_plen_59_part_00
MISQFNLLGPYSPAVTRTCTAVELYGLEIVSVEISTVVGLICFVFFLKKIHGYDILLI